MRFLVSSDRTIFATLGSNSSPMAPSPLDTADFRRPFTYSNEIEIPSNLSVNKNNSSGLRETFASQLHISSGVWTLSKDPIGILCETFTHSDTGGAPTAVNAELPAFKVANSVTKASYSTSDM